MNSTRYDERAGVLRFMVPVGGQQVTAFIAESTWHSHSGWPDEAPDLGTFYELHRSTIDGVIERKVRAGARSPVVVRAGDL